MTDAGRAGLPEAQAARLAERLAGARGLVLPRHLLRALRASDVAADSPAATGPGSCGADLEVPIDARRKYVRQLLLHDAGVFLERHGKLLTREDLEAFAPLRGNYEVDFYVRLLQQESSNSSSSMRNRRLAYFNRNKGRGHFSFEAMQDRDPLLWQHLIGRYTQVSEHMPTLAGKMYENLLRQHDALELRLRIRSEQEREAQRTEEKEEEEEEEDEEEEGAVGPSCSAGYPQTSETPVFGGIDDPEGEDYQPMCATEEQRQELQGEFEEEMKVRFINGRDDFDYSLVDNDAGLDEDWAKCQAQDAEDKYFDSD